MTTTHPPPTVLAVCNVKGGTGKTTTAAYAAHALHESGLRVLGVDGDPQASFLHWHEAASFPFPVVGQPSGKLHRDVPGIAGDRYDAVVIDTPPTEKGPTIVHSAMRACTHLLVPIAPTPAEYERLADLGELLADAAAMRDTAPVHGVHLGRTVPHASSTEVYRGLIADDGWRVLRSTVPRRESYAQALGGPVEGALDSHYGDAVHELLDADPAPDSPDSPTLAGSAS